MNTSFKSHPLSMICIYLSVFVMLMWMIVYMISLVSVHQNAFLLGIPMGRRDRLYMTWTHVTFYFTSCWVSWNWISFCTLFIDCKIYSNWLLPTNDPSNVDLEPMQIVPPNIVISEVFIGSINEDEHPTYVEHEYVLPSTDFSVSNPFSSENQIWPQWVHKFPTYLDDYVCHFTRAFSIQTTPTPFISSGTTCSHLNSIYYD